MNKTLHKILLGILLASSITYAIGRFFFPNIITDDVGDWFLMTGAISALLYVLSLSVVRIPSPTRKTINVVSLASVTILTFFGLWGMFTDSGQDEYPELAALIPFYALLFSGGIFGMVLLFNIVWSLRRK
jgi:hypothetical protein